LTVAVASMRVNRVERQNNLSAGRVLCAVRATCVNPWSLADRSVAQPFQSEHVPLEAWPQGGARSRPRRQCSRDPQSFSGAPRSFRAWSCAELRWARGAFNSVERLSLVREQVKNYFRFYIKSRTLDADCTSLPAVRRGVLRPISPRGQSYNGLVAMSAFGGKADMTRTCSDVRF